MDAVFFESIQRLRCFLWVGSELIHCWDSQLNPWPERHPRNKRIYENMMDVLQTLRRKFLRHRKQPGGRKDQRFLGKVAERRFIRRLTILHLGGRYIAVFRNP